MDYIFITKTLIFLAFLLYACVSDIKTKTVRNAVWWAALTVESPFAVVTYWQLDYAAWKTALVMGLLGIFVIYTLYVNGAIGGADAKCFLLILLIFPGYTFLKLAWAFFLANMGMSIYHGMIKKDYSKTIPAFPVITLAFLVAVL